MSATLQGDWTKPCRHGDPQREGTSVSLSRAATVRYFRDSRVLRLLHHREAASPAVKDACYEHARDD